MTACWKCIVKRLWAWELAITTDPLTPTTALRVRASRRTKFSNSACWHLATVHEQVALGVVRGGDLTSDSTNRLELLVEAADVQHALDLAGHRALDRGRPARERLQLVEEVLGTADVLRLAGGSSTAF